MTDADELTDDEQWLREHSSTYRALNDLHRAGHEFFCVVVRLLRLEQFAAWLAQRLPAVSDQAIDAEELSGIRGELRRHGLTYFLIGLWLTYCLFVFVMYLAR